MYTNVSHNVSNLYFLYHQKFNKKNWYRYGNFLERDNNRPIFNYNIIFQRDVRQSLLVIDKNTHEFEVQINVIYIL